MEISLAKKPDQRTKFRTIRLSEAEATRFAVFCGAHGVSESEALRRFVRSSIGFGPSFGPEASAAIRELTRQIRAIGVNINQAVRAMNTGLVPDSAPLREQMTQIQGGLTDMAALYDGFCARQRKVAVEIVRETVP